MSSRWDQYYAAGQAIVDDLLDQGAEIFQVDSEINVRLEKGEFTLQEVVGYLGSVAEKGFFSKHYETRRHEYGSLKATAMAAAESTISSQEEVA